MMRIVFALAACAFSSTAIAQKYYVVVNGVDEATGVSSGISDEAKQLFIDELKRHDELTLEAPPGLPTEPRALDAALKERKLRAFEVTLKIQSVKRSVDPPPPGKQYRVLVRGVKLSVFGDTLPEKVMAIGGDGEAEVGEEVGRNDDIDVKGKKLLIECAKTAIKQAVDMTITKLNLADKPGKASGAKKPKKKKA
jgi:hypothetical protein